jgi:hypothetical protein
MIVQITILHLFPASYPGNLLAGLYNRMALFIGDFFVPAQKVVKPA